MGDGASRKMRAGASDLVGWTNCVKSTLLNRLVGEKIAAVADVAQTTRNRITGVRNVAGRGQIVFVDTPGLFRTKRKLDRAMVAAAWSGAADADVVVLLVEAHRGISKGVEMILEGLEKRNNPKQVVALAINKIDKVKSEVLLALTKELNERFSFAETFLISAEKGHGVEALATWLAETLPEGPWRYPEDQIADAPMRMITAEITREKLMLRRHQELPYQLTVETEHWTERKDGSVRIDQVIYVSRDGHKGILLGHKGETIKAVGKAAREELEEFLGRKVHLFLPVTVRAGWLDEAARYSEMGLGFKAGNGGHAPDRPDLGRCLSDPAAPVRHPRLRRLTWRRHGGRGSDQAQHAGRAGGGLSAVVRPDERGTQVDGAGRGRGTRRGRRHRQAERV